MLKPTHRSIFTLKNRKKNEKSPLDQFLPGSIFFDTSGSIFCCGRFDFLEKNNSKIIVWKFITIKQFMDFFYLQTFTSDMFLTYSVNPVKHLEYILHFYSLWAENHANILKRSKNFKILQNINRSFLSETNTLLTPMFY